VATIKTAISLQDTLFTQVEDLAHILQMSRSQLVSLALEAFVQRYQNQQLLAALNSAYEDAPSPDEPARTTARRRQHRQIVEGEW
jgi:metal-responsive CopG/Arc/MetJ family transcriptional regulator